MNFWSEKNVLITGATGFVGFWLAQRLVSENARVVALVRDHDPKSLLYQSGLSEHLAVVSGALESCETLERALCEYEIDTVFHLGAQTLVGTAYKAPLLTFEANIRGTYNLLEACRRQSGAVERIVIVSSDKAYGTSATLPYTEQMPLKPSFPYDVSKACSDLIAQSYYMTYGLPLTIARCGNIFGGGDLNWSRIIPGTIRSLLKNQPPLIRSDGTFIRDYIYVQDVVEAYLLLARHATREGIQGEAFNFAPSKPYSVLEIVGILQDLMGCAYLQPHILNRAQAEIHDQFLTSQKAHDLLNWSAHYSLEEGLAKTVEWYRNHLSSKSYAIY